MYRVASASEYLVITGIGIDDIKIAKKAWILPGQFYSILDISLVNYTFEVQAMSAEKLPFILPVVFTIGPHSDDMESLHKYAKLIDPHDNVNELVKGIIEGEIRVLAASMTMEKIFKRTKEFKEEVSEKVQTVLNQFGLWIYNANIKQLVVDTGLGQKTQMKAVNQAKIDVSVAKMKEMQEHVKKEEIRLSMEVKMFENEMEAELVKVKAEVAMKKAKLAKDLQLEMVEANKVVAIREAELQEEVERLKELARMEKLKAELLRKTTEYEIKVEEAKLELYKKQKEVEAIMYQKVREAKAQKEIAETNLYASKLVADGKLYAKEKEAEGLVVLSRAQGFQIKTLLGALGGNFAHLREYLMLYEGKIAKINTGSSGCGNSIGVKEDGNGVAK